MSTVSVFEPCTTQDKATGLPECVPSRLFVCFGFEYPFTYAADFRLCFATADFLLVEALTETLAVGAGAGLETGDRRKADGEGIEMVAIELNQAYSNWK